MIDGTWKEKDFSGYDAVFHVAGLAHADGTCVQEIKSILLQDQPGSAIETAKKAKVDRVRQFIFMSR